MATGWWAELVFAKIAAAAQRATAALAGEQPQSGSIAVQAQRGTAELTGTMEPAGILAAQAQRAAAALTGVMQPAGILAAQAQRAAAALAGGQTQQGTIAATAQRATAAMSGSQAAALQFIGANASISASVTIPPHQVGDIIVIYPYDSTATTAPTKPSVGGTIPNWTYIDNANGANINGSTTAYFVATATNTTSGSWGSATGMIAAVLRNQNASPIGGHAESGSTATSGAVAPAITMSVTNGTSIVLEFFGRRPVTGFTAWSAAPAGYTQRAATVSGTGVCLDTKDVTTSDGSVTQGTDGSSSIGYRGATVEIIAA